MNDYLNTIYNDQTNAFAPTLDQRVSKLESVLVYPAPAREFTRTDFITIVATSSVLTGLAIVALTLLKVL